MSTADFIALFTCIGTWMYVIATFLYLRLVVQTLKYLGKQVETQVKERKFEETLAIFKEMQALNLTDARRYIYENVPENIEGIENSKLWAHLQKIEIAIINLDRVGYLVHQDHIDAKMIMETYWPSIWRCWKKTESFIKWLREQRNERHAYRQFEYLFNLSESYRIQNELPEPKFYRVTTVIQTT